MNKIIGYLYKGVGKIVDVFLTFLIAIVNILVEVFSSIKHAFGLLISFSGCLFLLFFFNPFLWAMIFNPPLMTVIALAILVPFIGKIAVSYLKYAHYVTTEFFYDRADHYLLGKNYAFEDFSEYGRKYRVKEEEKRRKEEEERRKKQEEEWNRRFQNFGGSTFTWTFGDFDDFFEQMNNGNFNQGQYQQGNYGGYQQQQSYQNMGMSFKQQYEDACDILGVAYGADKYEIKLAYRKKAKQYHPDINKADNAKEMFQKVNNAYEFLNDSNIERYQRMSRNM
ncbi:MAG: DnaJ domain-containing protein [Tissierellia bacterium]|nr:DnaJ domain-containing protein [Tissierellia bacterium]